MGLIFSLIAGGIAIATIAIPAIGFGAAGIIEGSIAAGIQSAVGNVAAGSAFAALQGLGASGVLGAIGATAGGTALGSAALALFAGCRRWGR